jgi:hypothetical protein
MKIYFNDKESLRKELVSKENKKLIIGFRQNRKIELTRNMLFLIQQICKQDRTFLKTLISSEANFVYFVSKFV